MIDECDESDEGSWGPVGVGWTGLKTAHFTPLHKRLTAQHFITRG